VGFEEDGDERMNIGTSNFKVAAFALSAGYPVLRTSRSGRRVTFIFRDTPSIREALESYRFGDPTIPVHAYEAAQARLKSLIFDAPFGETETC
jgi:hypothetical protein